MGTAELHTVMEAVATVLALVVGALALVRFYSHKSIPLLFVGTGFIGTGLLDGYHALVTSVFFSPFLPSGLPSLIPWSWIASRLFLSVMIWLSWLAWRWEAKPGAENQADDAVRSSFSLINERTIYSFAAILTFASFVFFAFVPLPRAYYPELVFHRPEEFLPAFFFALALVT